MAYLNREAILAVDDTVYEDVNVPEWGGMVRLRGLTGAERDRMEASIASNPKKPNLVNFRAKMIAASVCDESGGPVFGTADISALGNKSAVALERVFNTAIRLSGMTDEDVKQLTEDLDNAPSDSFTSD
jgi:hypothetical protein